MYARPRSRYLYRSAPFLPFGQSASLSVTAFLHKLRSATGSFTLRCASTNNFSRTDCIHERYSSNRCFASIFTSEWNERLKITTNRRYFIHPKERGALEVPIFVPKFIVSRHTERILVFLSSARSKK